APRQRRGGHRQDSSSRNGSALPGWGRQGRAPEEGLTSSSSLPPSSSSPSCHLPPPPRARGWLGLWGGSTGGPRRVSRRKYTLEGVFERTAPISGGGVARYSRTDDGLRCSRRRTNSWFSGMPFLHIGHCSGGYVGKSRLTRLKISLPATSAFFVRRQSAPMPTTWPSNSSTRSLSSFTVLPEVTRASTIRTCVLGRMRRWNSAGRVTLRLPALTPLVPYVRVGREG